MQWFEVARSTVSMFVVNFYTTFFQFVYYENCLISTLVPEARVME